MREGVTMIFWRDIWPTLDNGTSRRSIPPVIRSLSCPTRRRCIIMFLPSFPLHFPRQSTHQTWAVVIPSWKPKSSRSAIQRRTWHIWWGSSRHLQNKMWCPFMEHCSTRWRAVWHTKQWPVQKKRLASSGESRDNTSKVWQLTATDTGAEKMEHL
jgi:hypothetical protein